MLGRSLLPGPKHQQCVTIARFKKMSLLPEEQGVLRQANNRVPILALALTSYVTSYVP